MRLGQEADLVIIAPATADLMARAASGRADDLLTSTLLTARCPVMFVPAMHTEMWEHPATQTNVRTLREHGATVITPASGRLTGVDSGAGRLPDPQEIALLGELLLERPDALPYDLDGVRFLISAGGTREPLDPVRYLGNRSSGKQGYALARAAAQRGAQVTLVAGATDDLATPAGVDVVRIKSAEQLSDGDGEARTRDRCGDHGRRGRRLPADDGGAVQDQEDRRRPGADRADHQPRHPGRSGRARVAPVRSQHEVSIVGFAAETGDEHHGVLDHGRAKLARKGCDLLVVNAVGDGKAFGMDHNTGWVLAADGQETALPLGTKTLMASRILDAVALRTDDGMRTDVGTDGRCNQQDRACVI